MSACAMIRGQPIRYYTEINYSMSPILPRMLVLLRLRISFAVITDGL